MVYNSDCRLRLPASPPPQLSLIHGGILKLGLTVIAPAAGRGRGQVTDGRCGQVSGVQITSGSQASGGYQCSFADHRWRSNNTSTAPRLL